MTKWIIGSNAFYLSCSNCGELFSEATAYCPHCGEKIGDNEPIGFCEDCEYMHELVLRYNDDEKVLRPECWGQKNPIRVKYTDSCKDFKQRED